MNSNIYFIFLLVDIDIDQSKLNPGNLQLLESLEKIGKYFNKNMPK